MLQEMLIGCSIGDLQVKDNCPDIVCSLKEFVFWMKLRSVGLPQDYSSEFIEVFYDLTNLLHIAFWRA